MDAAKELWAVQQYEVLVWMAIIQQDKGTKRIWMQGRGCGRYSRMKRNEKKKARRGLVWRSKLLIAVRVRENSN